MKKFYFLSVMISLGTVWGFGQEDVRTLPPFTKLVIHPFIDVELNAGETSQMIVQTQNWNKEDVIVERNGETLDIYLRGLKTKDIKGSWEKHKQVRVKVFILYQDLKKISLRGDGDLICHGAIAGPLFKLKVFGDSEVRLAQLDVDKFKLSAFGDAEIYLAEGRAAHQKWSIFGDNEIMATGLRSESARLRLFGDNELTLNTRDHISCTSFGDMRLQVVGDPQINKTVFGDSQISRKN